jgi:uncharacterized protein YrrD
MADPVSWFLVQHGWSVYDAEGEEIGHVGEVTGDENHDIFDGLTIHGGLLSKEKYVPAEHVASISDGEVRLSLTHAEVETLQDFTEPPAEEQIIPEGSTWYQRLAWWLTGRNR